MGRAKQRPWLAIERDRLKAWRAAGVTHKQCALWLGRTVKATRAAAQGFGFARKWSIGRDSRRLHERGLRPAAIARRLGRSTKCVIEALQRQGIAPRSMDRAERTRRMLGIVRRRYGMWPGQIRRERERVAAVHDGWPPVTAGLVPYLERYYRLGPATRGEDARRSGVCVSSAHRARRLLLRGGWLVVVGRARGGRTILDLAPAVRARRAEVLAYRSDAVPA